MRFFDLYRAQHPRGSHRDYLIWLALWWDEFVHVRQKHGNGITSCPIWNARDRMIYFGFYLRAQLLNQKISEA